MIHSSVSQRFVRFTSLPGSALIRILARVARLRRILTVRGLPPTCWIRKKGFGSGYRSATPKTANCVAGHIVQRERGRWSNSHCRGNGASHEHDEPQHNRRPFELLAALE